MKRAAKLLAPIEAGPGLENPVRLSRKIDRYSVSRGSVRRAADLLPEGAHGVRHAHCCRSWRASRLAAAARVVCVGGVSPQGNLFAQSKTVQMDSPLALIVEDFRDLATFVALLLVARGFQVLLAETGRAAIRSAMNSNPSFILLDLRLPDMNGLEVAQELHESPLTEQIPIIGWSVEPPSNPEQETLRLVGIMDWLQKPVSLKTLDAAVERFLPKGLHSST